MPMHALQPWKHFITDVAVVSMDFLADTMVMHRVQVSRQFAGTCERRRTAPTV